MQGIGEVVDGEVEVSDLVLKSENFLCFLKCDIFAEGQFSFEVGDLVLKELDLLLE